MVCAIKRKMDYPSRPFRWWVRRRGRLGRSIGEKPCSNAGCPVIDDFTIFTCLPPWRCSSFPQAVGTRRLSIPRYTHSLHRISLSACLETPSGIRTGGAWLPLRDRFQSQSGKPSLLGGAVSTRPSSYPSHPARRHSHHLSTLRLRPFPRPARLSPK